MDFLLVNFFGGRKSKANRSTADSRSAIYNIYNIGVAMGWNQH